LTLLLLVPKLNLLKHKLRLHQRMLLWMSVHLTWPTSGNYELLTQPNLKSISSISMQVCRARKPCCEESDGYLGSIWRGSYPGTFILLLYTLISILIPLFVCVDRLSALEVTGISATVWGNSSICHRRLSS
jgi:hypothetical protein